MKMMVTRTGAGTVSSPRPDEPCRSHQPPIKAITDPTTAMTTSPSIAHLGFCRASCLASFLICLDDAQAVSQPYAPRWEVDEPAVSYTVAAIRSIAATT